MYIMTPINTQTVLPYESWFDLNRLVNLDVKKTDLIYNL